MEQTSWTPCLFCAGWYKLLGDPKYEAMHTVPSCHVYDVADGALEFAAKARRVMGIPDPDEN